ncbi:hypothetical protein D6851_15485 [Altericroceibacterium spongiae]|uniref:Lipoprotein n=2 Tax=Altericroceibacterium spongiae TaxID=2320269 RepID=A0A420EC12_9SPHN|nr:hypothetical protein D6851_15485 [Altericroceibacterium spongiae]
MPFLPCIAFALSACVHTSPAAQAAPPPNSARQPATPPLLRLTPEQAVINAAAVAPDGVKGIFELTVRGTGRDGGYLYLNSQKDYRDQRSLNIEISPSVQRELADRFGIDPRVYLAGKRIAVRGEAKRVLINFTYNGAPTGKYYYQTHIALSAPEDLTVAGEQVPLM